ncbi:MAG: ComEC/Rec2 family competence protein [Acidimicrobiales bacterium]
MSDLAAVVMALSAAAGAWAAQPLPLGAGLAISAAALTLRRPLVLCVGVALATSALGARSWAGLRPPATGTWSGSTTLVGDPYRSSGALVVVVRIGAKRVEAWARGRPATALGDRLAGEQVWITGRFQPLSPLVRRRMAPRHVAASLSVQSVGDWAPGDAASRAANGIRRTLLSGTASLPPSDRALFAGFVLGDDRDESPEVADDFRASGLTHLLVVSGENVAFVLGLVAPLLRRLGLRGRMVAGLAVLGLFGVITRWEPSVLRAEAMAAVSLAAASMGRPASALRMLSLAVTGLLVVDPLLVGSLGFLLSVGACAGMAFLAPPLTRAIPGPRPIASALGVSLAAQAGVAPLLVPAFGTMPLATIPANLLAVPAAGPLTAWGMGAGLPAGLIGGRAASVAHLPTRLALWWVAGVARHAALAPLGHVNAVDLAALAVIVAAAACTGRHRRWWLAAGAAVLVTAMLPAVAPGAVDGRQIADGARFWRRDGATLLVVDGARSAGKLLAGLHQVEARRLDVVVVTRPGAGTAAAVGPVLARFAPRLLLAAESSRLPGAQVPAAGTTLALGSLEVTVGAAASRLTVDVAPSGARPP